MTIEEKIKYINKISKTKLSKIVGVSRQTIYIKLKKKEEKGKLQFLYEISV